LVTEVAPVEQVEEVGPVMIKEEPVRRFPDSHDREPVDRRESERKRNYGDVPTATIEDAIGELPLLAGLVAVANVAAAYLLVRRAAQAVSDVARRRF